MELSRFLRPSILKFDDWFINVSIGSTGGEDSNIQKDVYFSGKNAYLYASTGSGVTELHIFGNSVQDGTPSIENPVPIISVGENYLQLYSLDINDPSKSGQIIDFGNIKLRSLPNGVCDEIVYKNGQWTHIQRIASIIIDENTTIQDQLAASNRIVVQVNYTLVTKSSANNTNLCSKISNSASSVPRFHNYPTTIYVVWNSNKPATFEEAKSLVMDAEFLCELAEPVETILDLPGLQTLNGTTYLLTNDQQVKPYLQGYYDVDTTISGKKIEYIQDGLIGYYTAKERSNTDENKNILPDLSGNGNDLENKNFAYTVESGYGQGYIQYDGIDDYSVFSNTYSDVDIHVHCICSDYDSIENNNSIWGSGSSSGIVSRLYNRNGLIAIDPSGSTSWLNGNEYVNRVPPTNELSVWSSNIHSDYMRLNLGTLSNNAVFFSKVRIYDFLLYNRYLIDEEVQNNFLVSQIRNGINIPNDIDPIDIISTPTYGSGKAFPVYNTYIDRNNNNVESLIICGYTEQDGTPTPENPIELKSVGDQSLVLCIYNEDKSKVQYIDFGDIVLRSLPDGTCDSIEWDGKNWRHVQRVWRINLSNAYYHNTTAKFALVDLNPTYGGLHNNPNYVMSNRFVIGSFEDMSNNIGIAYINSVNNTYAFNFENEHGTNEHVREWLADNPTELIYKLSTPIETILEGIPAPQTYDQVTYFSTPNTEVRPYIMATVKAIKPLEYQGDISAWWYFGGNKSNETDRQITDISGNGNDLTPYNFAWTRESGWNQGSIHSDGIDDNLISNIKNFKSGLFITSDVWNSKSYIQYIIGIVIGTRNGGVIVSSANLIGNANAYVTIEPNNVPSEPINIFLQKNNVSDQVDKFRLFCFPDYTGNYSAGNLHEYILFSTELTDDQILNNKKLITQRNGIDDHVNFTAIASGKKFPIYYTIEGDTIKELHIYGESMQEGTPTHDTPQEIYSSGDEGLKLCVTDSETGNALQVIDFGNIVLRSLPSGIRDEIVYKDGTWTYIQRVSAIVFSEFSNTEIAVRYENTETKEIIQVLIVNSAIGHYCKNGTLCYCNSASPVLLLNPTDNNTVSYTINTGTSTGWRFGIQGITVDDIDAYVQDYKVQCEIETPIETTLDLPGITTYADITYIGTPNAKVKPYIECVAETYKSLEFVKDGLIELYDFAPSKWQDNKIYNEIDNSQYITANNFNNTVESGAFSNYTQFDGIDDYFTDNNNVDSIFFQIYATDLVGVEAENRWLLAYDLGTPNTGLFINNNTYLICNNGSSSIDEGEKNNNIPRDLWGTGIHSYQGFSNSVGSLSCIGNYNSGDFYTKYKLYALLTYSSELTTEQIANNLNCFKQFKGIDGDIDISNESQLLDSQGNELTDSQGYYLTVAS